MRRSISEKSAFQLDQELAGQLVAERGPTVATIFLIAEIDRRQTYVEQGFSSTWDYVRRVHNQSDTMIHYRLTCARAVNRFRQVIEPLRDGRLCMTTLAKLMEVMNEANCDALLAEALGKSKGDVKRIVAREKPHHVPRDVRISLVPAQVTTTAQAPDRAVDQPVRKEILTESLARMYFTVDREYDELEKEVRAALSHKMPGAALLDLIKEGYRATIRESKKGKGIVEKPRATKIAKQGKISQSVKWIVEKRDGGKCQWHSDDGESADQPIASSSITFRIAPRAGTPENIIQICEKHHLLATEIAWGADKIEAFRRRPREKAADELQSRLDFHASP
jgi:hypothetical protein